MREPDVDQQVVAIMTVGAGVVAVVMAAAVGAVAFRLIHRR